MSQIKKFFEEEVPQAFLAGLESLRAALEEAEGAGDTEKAGRLKKKLDSYEDVEATLRIEITGDGGGDFYFNYFDAELEVSDEGQEDPILWLTQTVDDFNALDEAGINPLAAGGGGMGGGGGGAVRLGPLNPETADKLRDFVAVLKFTLSELPEDAGSATTLVRFGEGNTESEPEVSVEIAYPDFKDILSGELLGPQAFMMGKIRIEGDMSIVMRLASLGMG